MISVASIVEGHGDRDSIPILIRRIAQRLDATLSPVIPHPIRIPKGRLLRAGEFERAVELGALHLGDGGGGVLVMLDADDDCPAELGPALLARAQVARPDIAFSIVVAKSEFESWFVASAASLAGRRGLLAPLIPPPDPEGIRDAKGWLDANMSIGQKYTETLDQPALTALFNLDEALRCSSFEKCYREIARLVTD